MSDEQNPAADEGLVEKIAKALFEFDWQEEIRKGRATVGAEWPKNAERQPYCQSYYRCSHWLIERIILTDREAHVGQARLEEAIEWSAMALNMSSEGFRLWCKSRIAALDAALKGAGTNSRP